MKVHVIGGGPAGLYFAILAKAADPQREITVLERHRPHETAGRGEVVSSRTCQKLEEVDPDTWAPVSRELVGWDTIEVHAHGEKVRAGGHGFCGVSRDRFTTLLQERARALGVELRFETRVDDPEPLRDCDLLVAADGIASVCRERWRDRFEPSHDIGESRFIWLGTRRRFETFTFSFRRTKHGVFQVHAYPFSEDMSTFIVECHESTWKRAGLDAASEAFTASFCEEIFAEELGGEKLLSNRSEWIRFDTLRNRRWTFDNVALMGDAAHTAHFSIGSGTKLALEDAVSLARALDEGSDVPAALSAYEADRRPRVERLQAAADVSRRWFENADRAFVLHTPQLAFSLMTRVPKVGVGELRKREPGYVQATERWFARHHAAPDEGVPPAAVPVDLGNLHLDGRLVRELTDDGAQGPDAALWIAPLDADLALARRRILQAQSEGRVVAARLDRALFRDDLALETAVTAARDAGADALELWVSPGGHPEEEADRVARMREAWGKRPVIARWDHPDGIALARLLRDRGVVDALHVPAASCEHLRNEVGLPVIAIIHECSDDDASTALLAGRADLVER